MRQFVTKSFPAVSVDRAPPVKMTPSSPLSTTSHWSRPLFEPLTSTAYWPQLRNRHPTAQLLLPELICINGPRVSSMVRLRNETYVVLLNCTRHPSSMLTCKVELASGTVGQK